MGGEAISVRQGDLVVRQSYGGDIVFAIEGFSPRNRNVLLRGVEYRLLADSPEDDLRHVPPADLSERLRQEQGLIDEAVRRFAEVRQHRASRDTRGRTKSEGNHSYFEFPGKVLHLDGDFRYLQKSMQLYRELGVPAEGYYVAEASMAAAIYRLLPTSMPDIIVLTGHDGFLKQRTDGDINSLSSYKNSHNFVNAVKAARQFERGRDNMAIIAGACQSHFEALLQAGANFASSPGRILIHALDPLCIAARLAFTSIKDTIQMGEMAQHTLSGLEGVGGLETKGYHRIGLPKMRKQAVT
jgi:spore coat assembly protein